MTTEAATQKPAKPASKPPMTTHPWFPAIVGLWFAALFGLSSLAVPPAMLESVVTALGIDRVIAAAEPPLGQTARLLTALGLSSVGEIIGLLFGRWIGRRNAAPPAARNRSVAAAGETARRARDAHPDAPPRKPLSATEDLGGVDNALRRRALASEVEHQPRPFMEMAPLPGGIESAQVEAIPDEAFGATGQGPAATDTEYETMDPQPFAMPASELDLGSFEAAEPCEGMAAPFAHPGQTPAAPAPFAPAFSAPAAAAIAPVAEEARPAGDVVAALRNDYAARAPAAEVVDVATASLETLGVVQLSERLALAMQARRERLALRPVAPALPALAIVDEPEASEAGEPFVFEAAEASAVAPDGEACASSPDVAEAIEDEPAQGIVQAESKSLPRLPGALVGFDVPVEDEPAEDDMPMLARSLSVAARPFAQPQFASPVEPAVAGEPAAAVVAEADEVVEPTPALDRGLEILARRAAREPGGVAELAEPDGEADDEDAAAEDSYSSLLSIGGAFRREEPVHIEIDDEPAEFEPVVVFPGHGRPSGAASLAPFAPPPAGTFPASVPAPVPQALPPEASAAAPASDPAEAERALKAALASLQRISGAR